MSKLQHSEVRQTEDELEVKKSYKDTIKKRKIKKKKKKEKVNSPQERQRYQENAMTSRNTPHSKENIKVSWSFKVDGAGR